MSEPSPEELADEMLAEYADSKGVTLRDLGIINRHRARRINDREMPMSSVWPNTLPPSIRPDKGDDEEED